MKVFTVQPLAGRNILIGISGGVAAYKVLSLIRLCKKAGAAVRVVVTEHAKQFVTPTSIQALSGLPPHDDLWDPAQEAAMGHIDLAKWADLMLIAPATAATLGRSAQALADNLLTTTFLATEAPVWFYPAMNQAMWASKPVQAQVCTLQGMGYTVHMPEAGEQACGDVGAGRLPEPETIFEAICQHFAMPEKPLKGQKAVVSAGPTREAIDPVRYISNHSSGKMGFALAQALQEAGAEVTLVAGPCDLPTPRGVARVDVVSACQMYDAVHEHVAGASLFIGAAAVADYRPNHCPVEKLKKGQADLATLALVENPDIIASVASRTDKPLVVGFAAETEHLRDYAYDKLQRKGLDLLIANQVGEGEGFCVDDNEVIIISQTQEKRLEKKAKPLLAREIVSYLTSYFSFGHAVSSEDETTGEHTMKCLRMQTNHQESS